MVTCYEYKSILVMRKSSDGTYKVLSNLGSYSVQGLLLLPDAFGKYTNWDVPTYLDIEISTYSLVV